MSFQLSILKILAGQPDGLASIALVRQYLEMFYTSGPDWAKRMKHLASLAPDIDIFSQQLISHRPGEWLITDKGRAVLEALERSQASVTKWPELETARAKIPIKPLPRSRSQGSKRSSRSGALRNRGAG